MVDNESAEIIAEHILTRDDVLSDISDHVQHGRAWLYYEGGNGYFLCPTLREIYQSWDPDEDFTYERFKEQFFAEPGFQPRVVNAATMRYAIRLAKQREQEENEEQQAFVRCLVLAVEQAEAGKVVARETGKFVSARTGKDGFLVQMHADGTFDIDGDPECGGNVPTALKDRVNALISPPPPTPDDEESTHGHKQA